MKKDILQIVREDTGPVDTRNLYKDYNAYNPMVKKGEGSVYKTIRIYADDHEELLKKYSKDMDFAEIIHQLVNKKVRRLE